MEDANIGAALLVGRMFGRDAEAVFRALLLRKDMSLANLTGRTSLSKSEVAVALRTLISFRLVGVLPPSKGLPTAYRAVVGMAWLLAKQGAYVHALEAHQAQRAGKSETRPGGSSSEYGLFEDEAFAAVLEKGGDVGALAAWFRVGLVPMEDWEDAVRDVVSAEAPAFVGEGEMGVVDHDAIVAKLVAGMESLLKLGLVRRVACPELVPVGRLKKKPMSQKQKKEEEEAAARGNAAKDEDEDEEHEFDDDDDNGGLGSSGRGLKREGEGGAAAMGSYRGFKQGKTGVALDVRVEGDEFNYPMDLPFSLGVFSPAGGVLLEPNYEALERLLRWDLIGRHLDLIVGPVGQFVFALSTPLSLIDLVSQPVVAPRAFSTRELSVRALGTEYEKEVKEEAVDSETGMMKKVTVVKTMMVEDADVTKAINRLKAIDVSGLMRKGAGGGMGDNVTYVLNVHSIMAHMQSSGVLSVIRTLHGPVGVRIVSYLRRNKFANEDMVFRAVLSELKTVRKKLNQLIHDGFVKTRQVARTVDYIANRSLYFLSFEETAVRTRIIRRGYKMTRNVLLRLDMVLRAERDLILAARNAGSFAMFSTEERSRFESVQHMRVKLTASVFHYLMFLTIQTWDFSESAMNVQTAVDVSRGLQIYVPLPVSVLTQIDERHERMKLASSVTSASSSTTTTSTSSGGDAMM